MCTLPSTPATEIHVLVTFWTQFLNRPSIYLEKKTKKKLRSNNYAYNEVYGFRVVVKVYIIRETVFLVLGLFSSGPI